MEINITKKQALKMVSAINCAGFGIYGIGHFNISSEEFAELLMCSFEKNRYKKCEKIYTELEYKYMR